MKYVLAPFSWLYGLVIACRNKAFDLGLLKSVDVGVPVISVGNITVGGTGKTPLVEYIVGVCLSKRQRVAVVSRGYKRETSGVLVVSNGKQVLVDAAKGGDEPVQIAKKFPRAIVVVGERRVDAARVAVNELNADMIVLDDGFQHRYLKRDLDIVVLDSRKNLFKLPMIPTGERREPLKALRRAHLIAFSKTDESTGWWNEGLDIFNAPTIEYNYRIDRVVNVGSYNTPSVSDVKGKKVVLFSGIGDHQGFIRQMKRAGLDVVGDLKFPDHHTYSVADLREIDSLRSTKGTNSILTTEKDIVRLSSNEALLKMFLESCSLYYTTIAVDIIRGRETLHSMIDKCLTRKVA
jgi:tetraacyldisaccharide 4'-kinase